MNLGISIFFIDSFSFIPYFVQYINIWNWLIFQTFITIFKLRWWVKIINEWKWLNIFLSIKTTQMKKKHCLMWFNFQSHTNLHCLVNWTHKNDNKLYYYGQSQIKRLKHRKQTEQRLRLFPSFHNLWISLFFFVSCHCLVNFQNLCTT